ncbi:ABC transporter ATP-binding protein [Frankia sp. CNm7]|uniref:ABC transporter ATP-binding protein n=1 Tax=Frankia nepalensis TaxID=1836974 RepID=A0A937RK20_9ACTN|nr:ABC transporter ATP-binding protein [Frankia nepalensis]MBL7496465.1 ABC transporter ATP-binding protein [Frankia nepalensis]MBL7510798.1 ABC transporter ATP-binding protein [Frankia nepalensis]MBL7521705.1 ABC transporter ATP-binding protein [Frankia nepalensis]MBL7631597.1 ABC transporter ATP-binding protein [Frankia nepalensis]
MAATAAAGPVPGKGAGIEPPLLELAGVRAGYGPIEVLHGVDLAVPAGSVVALLGPNGAGKTTTLNVCCGLQRPSSGELRLAGRSVTGASAETLARLGVCTIPERRGIFPNLTVRENLWMMTQARSWPRGKQARSWSRGAQAQPGVSLRDVEEIAYARFPVLGERRGQLAGTLSGGQQQMLALTRALGTDPAVLLLDELSMGLAPRVVRELYEIVGRLAAEGMSILIVEQFARTVLPIADQVALMLHGRIVNVGAPSEVEEHLSAAYLGA